MTSQITRAAFEEHRRVLDASVECLCPLVQEAAEESWTAVTCGGKLLICGNGGSAADAQHFAAELVARYKHERPAIAAVSLTTDTSALTALANDYGYDQVFARQVRALAKSGDILIAISTSGNSPSVINAAITARKIGVRVIGLTGEGGGKLAEHSDILLAVPSKVVARIQEIHEICLHSLAESLEEAAVSAAHSGSKA